MAKYRFNIIVEREEDGVYIASCPALKGCYSQGDTYEEAVENLKDAIRLHIEARREVGESFPIERLRTIEILAPPEVWRGEEKEMFDLEEAKRTSGLSPEELSRLEEEVWGKLKATR